MGWIKYRHFGTFKKAAEGAVNFAKDNRKTHHEIRRVGKGYELWIKV